jgi:cytochrome b
MNTTHILANFLGQGAHETATGLSEIYGGSDPVSYFAYQAGGTGYLNPVKGLGNITPAEAANYRGRGFLQLTGYNNYSYATWGYKDRKVVGGAYVSVGEKQTGPTKVSLNQWLGTEAKSSATSSSDPDGRVTVSGHVQPNWWVRVEIPKAGSMSGEFVDVQADASGNYVATSQSAHAAGTVNVTSVKYNLLKQYDLVSNPANPEFATLVGAWFWRFKDGQNHDLNKTPEFNPATQKINPGELGGNANPQLQQRFASVTSGVKKLAAGNSYGNIRYLLGDVGVSTKIKAGYNNQFGFSVGKRTALVLERRLESPIPTVAQNQPLADDSMVSMIQLGWSNLSSPAVAWGQEERQYLSDAVQDSIATQQEVDMLLASPDISSPADIAFQVQSAQVGNAHSSTSRASKEVVPAIGMCGVITSNNGIGPGLGWPLNYFPALLTQFPKGWAEQYLGRFVQDSPQKDWFDNVFLKGVTIDIVRQPKHGQLKLTNQDVLPAYVPGTGYKGKDLIEYIARAVGPDGRQLAVKVINYINVVPDADPYAESYEAKFRKFCKTAFWKISSGDASGVNSAVQIQWLDEPSFGSGLDLAGVIAEATKSIQGFVPLSEGVVGATHGQGFGASITLSAGAAGYGWYLDATPLDNTDDFLPTADSTVWRAKAGSAADGKMDLLSVLLHEYGHSLGQDHTGDSSDFMAATLQPGERRLPTADELAWMAQRVAELKAQQDAAGQSSEGTNGSGNLPANPTRPQPAYPAWGTLGMASRLSRRSPIRSASGTDPLLDASSSAAKANATQFATGVNATLTNGDFAQSGIPNGAGWMTQGDVRFTTDGAVLGEAGASQARLLQSFALGANDRLLSFTVAGPGLAANASGPNDAFEVALLDADSGLPVAGRVTLAGWDLPLRLLHWTLVGAVAVAALSTLVFGAAHQPAGYVALAAVLLRLAWSALGSRHARLQTFLRSPRATWAYARAVLQRRAPRYLGHNPLGGWMTVALMATVAGLALTGWLYTSDWLWGDATVEAWHRGLAWTLLVLVVLHIAGVLFTSWRHQENLVGAMISGEKREPGEGDID